MSEFSVGLWCQSFVSDVLAQRWRRAILERKGFRDRTAIVRLKQSMRRIGILCCALLLGETLLRAEAAAPRPQATLKTFTSDRFGVALEYPAAWSVEDDGDEVTFRAEDGQSIVLGRPGTDSPSEPAPGSRTTGRNCSTTTTPHDVRATVCVDSASMSRRAVLELARRDGRKGRLALRTRGRDAQTFDAMVSSIRRYP